MSSMSSSISSSQFIYTGHQYAGHFGNEHSMISSYFKHRSFSFMLHYISICIIAMHILSEIISIYYNQLLYFHDANKFHAKYLSRKKCDEDICHSNNGNIFISALAMRILYFIKQLIFERVILYRNDSLRRLYMLGQHRPPVSTDIHISSLKRAGRRHKKAGAPLV